MPDRPLTAKRRAFCREYIEDYNGTQAGVRAGYSPKTAQEQASRLLCNVMVLVEIARLEAERREISIANRADRQRFWTRTYLTAPNMSDRLRASELLGKSEADFITVDISANMDSPQSITPEQAERYARMAQAATAEQVGPRLVKETG